MTEYISSGHVHSNYVVIYVTVQMNIFGGSLPFCSDRPSLWCKDNWIHWRALKSAFSVETQLREILSRLQQVTAVVHVCRNESRVPAATRTLC